MPINLLVLELLQEASDCGRSPEDVCKDRPDLVGEIRECVRQLDLVRDELDALFPEEKETGAGSALRLGLFVRPQIPWYVVGEILGRGGMGVVYKARHLRLNRPVAVKMMLNGGFAGPPELARFQREAEVLAAPEHPNIVHVYDVGESEGLPYFTMEFVDGGNLAEKLGGIPQPARDAAGLMALLARAVEAAHRGGIVHRDLKPANILLTADGTPKITDFGLARRFDEGAGLSMTAVRIGTPGYMAPEQVAGHARVSGAATDVYALGAILYEMLTGRPPFRAETVAETERQVIEQEPVPPTRLNASVPRDLETVCLKCLEKEPGGRYATAGALAEDLNRFLNHESIRARPAGPLVRLARWGKRNPIPLASLSFVLVTSLIAIATILAVAQRGGAASDRGRGPATGGGGFQVRTLGTLSIEHLGRFVGAATPEQHWHGQAGPRGGAGGASQLGVATSEHSARQLARSHARHPVGHLVTAAHHQPVRRSARGRRRGPAYDQPLGHFDR
jgi:serine/threonine protein kinase